MKRITKMWLVAVGGALLLGVAGLAGFLWLFLHASVDESSGPTSRAEALRHVSIVLPPSAHHVQYASYACGLQDGEFYVRFEAPISDCHAAAQATFAQRAKSNPNFVIPNFEPVSHPASVRSHRLRTEWFDVGHISRGAVAGTGSGLQPRIWIDEERGIFYFQDAD